MTISKKAIVAFLLAFLTTAGASAQAKVLPETRNAALRYWMAFAQMQDYPTDQATADLLGKTAAGDAPWDETKLGPILDENREAIEILQRATKLPDCDWGLEYSLGPRTPVAPYLGTSARALARLNTLYGMRLAAKGDTQKAIDTWLAGMRFSQHLARGGSLIFSLFGKAALVPNLHALMQAVQSGGLNDAQRKQIESAVLALPETGFDWGRAMWYEEASLDVTIEEMNQAASPAAYYRELMGAPTPENFSVPKPADVAAYHKLMAGVEAALRLPPEKAQDRLKTLQASVSTLHPFFKQATPSLLKINDARAEVQVARKKLLQALSPQLLP